MVIERLYRKPRCAGKRAMATEDIMLEAVRDLVRMS